MGDATVEVSPAISLGGAQVPAPLDDATRIEVIKLSDLPESDTLQKWLTNQGLDTEPWGKTTGTKPVSNFWKEMKGGEAGLEVWQRGEETHPVRVVHVLRAKVCTVESYEHDVFLFNTWQQFGDGKRRTRNALLSEKLVYSELPLEPNLPMVCARAVGEEMGRVVEAAFNIGAGSPAPEYDPDAKLDAALDRVNFVNHTIDVERSPSFPGLLTMYHLYTVEIVCKNLPKVDFNTLEYNLPDANGSRSLKYVHAWVWLKWSQIQRYLFEGSDLKERKGKTSFADSDGMIRWLRQFDLDPVSWGKDKGKSAKELHKELQKEEAHLELWGRNDGVQLLMRVAHVIQLRVRSSDERMQGKFLLQVWQQSKNGSVRGVNRLLARKLSSSFVPFNHGHFHDAAVDAVGNKLAYLMDVHFQMDPQRPPAREDIKRCDIAIKTFQFVDHRHDVDESPAYKGMHTMYHLYTFDVECEGLPTADFSTLDFDTTSGPVAYGWRWVTWQQTMDILHAQVQAHDKREEMRNRCLKRHLRGIENVASTLGDLSNTITSLKERSWAEAEADKYTSVMTALQQARKLQQQCREAGETFNHVIEEKDFARSAEILPPSMLSKMASDTIATDILLEGMIEVSRKGSLEINNEDSKIIKGLTWSTTEETMPRTYSVTSLVNNVSTLSLLKNTGRQAGKNGWRQKALFLAMGLLIGQVSIQVAVLLSGLGNSDPIGITIGLISLATTTMGMVAALAIAAYGPDRTGTNAAGTKSDAEVPTSESFDVAPTRDRSARSSVEGAQQSTTTLVPNSSVPNLAELPKGCVVRWSDDQKGLGGVVRW